MRTNSSVVIIVLGLLAGGYRPSACELCAVFSASQARAETGKGLFAGLSEQYTSFGTLQADGHKVDNPAHQYLDSSISQVLAGYNITEKFGLQLNVPLIYRSFRRTQGVGIQESSFGGIGDLYLTANYQVYRHDAMHWTFTWSVLGGVKFPSGSTRWLAEETHETGAEPGLPSGIHGHDLTLGSGSYDGIIGTSLFARRDRWFATASVQYAIRSRGDYGYQYANDFIGSGGPGYFLVLKDDYTLSLQANVSGETKGRDNLNGMLAEDTGVSAVYAGPQFQATWRDKLSVQLGVDIPLFVENTSLQIVPDYRVRAGLTWHF